MAKVIDGVTTEKKIGPKLLREDLRKLPGEAVTNEIAIGDKIHEVDEPYVARQILRDRAKAEKEADTAEPEPKKLPTMEEQARIPLTQEHVDAIRMLTIKNRIAALREAAEAGEVIDLDERLYVWFPNPAIIPRELRNGNPPAPQDRPRHLRRLDLVVDIFNWPRPVEDAMRKLGVTPPTRKDYERWRRIKENQIIIGV